MMAVKLQSTSYPGQGHQLQHLVEDAADAPQVDGGGVVLRPQGKLLWHVPLGSDWGGGRPGDGLLQEFWKMIKTTKTFRG